MSDRIAEMEKRISLKKEGIIKKLTSKVGNKPVFLNEDQNISTRSNSDLEGRTSPLHETKFSATKVDFSAVSTLEIVESNFSEASSNEEFESLIKQINFIDQATELEKLLLVEFDKVADYISYENFLKTKLKNAKQEKFPNLKMIAQLNYAIDDITAMKQIDKIMEDIKI